MMVHEFASKMVTESASVEDMQNLNNGIPDVSHRVSAPTPANAEATSRPPPPTQVTEQARSSFRPRPPPPQPPKPTSAHTPTPALSNAALDPSVHCPYYDTRHKTMFRCPELYTNSFPSCWEAETFCAGNTTCQISPLRTNTRTTNRNTSAPIPKRLALVGAQWASRANRPQLQRS